MGTHKSILRDLMLLALSQSSFIKKPDADPEQHNGHWTFLPVQPSGACASTQPYPRCPGQGGGDCSRHTTPQVTHETQLLKNPYGAPGRDDHDAVPARGQRHRQQAHHVAQASRVGSGQQL